MHNIANIQIENPVILVFYSQYRSHIQFHFRILFQILKLTITPELYPGLHSESHPLCIISDAHQLTEFLNDAPQFLSDWLSLHNRIFQDFTFLFHVVDFRLI